MRNPYKAKEHVLLMSDNRRIHSLLRDRRLWQILCPSCALGCGFHTTESELLQLYIIVRNEYSIGT